MTKKDIQPKANPEPEIDAEIKDIMGLPPEDAAPVLAHDDIVDNSLIPTGPPELDSKDSVINELAEQMNKQIAIEQDEALTDVSTDEPAEATTAEPSNDETSDLDSADTIVDDIIAKEGDDLLAANDAKAAALQPKKTKKGIGHFFGAWWHNKKARNLTFLLLVAIIAVIALLPYTRYKVLNLVGAKASLSLQVVDEKSGFPLKNVEVSAGGAKAVTDENGNATLSGIQLGKTQLELLKRSFAPVSESIVVGWGSNPFLDPYQMQAVGTSFTFIVKDQLSDKPIAKVEISDGESVALSDDDGRAVLTLQPKEGELTVTVKSKDYATKTITLATNEKEDTSVTLMPGKPDVFVSKRSGRYDLYKRDIDGKNEVILMAGTGTEQDSLALLVHPDAATAAYVTSRDGKRNKDGFLLSNLYIVDIAGKTATKVEATESEQVQLIDWVGDKLIFVKIVSGPSGNTVGRQRLISYDLKQDKQTEIASANYFNDVEVFNGKVYYAVSGSPQLTRVNADNSAKTTLLNFETWMMYRTSYEKIVVSATNNKWYEQKLSESTMTALAGAPATPVHRTYIDNPSADKSIWFDVRDGKGVLLLHDVKVAGEDTILATKSGLGYPARWLSDKHLLVRITTAQETADYVMNIDGGEMKKVGDVTTTAPTNRWYYYH